MPGKLRVRPRVAVKPKAKKAKVRRDLNTPVKKRELPVKPGGMLTSFGTGGRADEKHFQIALLDPFDTRALGARVCDSYTTPTATYHVRAGVTLTTDAGGSAVAVFLPSPCLSAVVPATGAGGAVLSGLTAFAQNVQGAAAAGAYYMVNPTTLAGVLTEYRVVSWGIRLLAKDTAMASKGKVYMAMVPTTEDAPSWNTFDTITGTQTSIGEYTIGMNLATMGGMVNLPGVRTFSMQDLLRGEVMAVGTPTNGSFYAFKGTADRANVPWAPNTILADEAVFSSATSQLVNNTAAGRKDVASLRGGRAIIIYMTGAPANVNEIDAELVYHLEGTPNVIASAGQALVPSAMRAANGSTMLVERALAIASKVNSLIRFVKDPANVAAATRALQFMGL